MATYRHGRLSYLEHVPDEPMETYFTRLTDQLRQAIIDHPEDEIPLLQQLMIYESVNGEPEDVIRMAKRLLELDKEKEFASDADHVLARMYSEIGDPGEAAKYYKETIRIGLEKSKKRGYMCDEAIIELGELYEEQKDWDNALRTYDLLNNKRIDNGKENMYRMKGDVYMKMNQWEKAMECFDGALDCCMKYEWVVRSIGSMHIQDKVSDDLLELHKKDLDKDYQKPEAYCRMGLIYQDRKDDLLAMHYYTEALKLKPRFAEAYNNMAQLAFEFESDLKKSATLLHKAKECAQEEIDDLEKLSRQAENEIEDLDIEKIGVGDEEAVKAIEKKIREAETKIHHNNSKIENYKWLMTLADLNLSRVYGKMTDFKNAAYYRSQFVENMGFSITESDDEDDDEGEW